jgi:uncharacterized protein YyaL (SSP411 family)
MLRKLAISVVLVIFFLNQVALSAEFRFSPWPNKAHLIKWRQWGNESFDEAKRDDKLILLSLSAVWCHWCHVMDETTYSDIDIIDYINKNFVPVRVDANMRPDVDSLYNQGGWPSTIILTPEGEIVQGGTYISQEAMIAWLSRSVEMFTNNKKAIKERIDTIKKRREDTQQTELTAPGNPDIVRITRIIESSYDRKYGGFGTSQKFPNPDTIDFLLSEYQSKKDPEVKTMISTTLENMFRGEIYDSVEGGFFRYSTMPDWSAPHYEKMLELNAALVRNYASAYLVIGNSNYKKVLNETIAYIEKYLYDGKQGAFFGSQDADEAYYKRTKRPGVKPPYVDRTIYADSNAQMITALIAAGGALGKQGYLETAKKTADFIIKKLYSKNDGVYHYYSGDKRLSGLLSDNVLFGLALIDLYNATSESRYLTSAEHIAHLLTDKFYDSENKQFRPTLDTTGVKPFTASALWDYNAFLSNYRAVIFLSRLYYCNESRNMKEISDEVSAKLRNTYERYEPSAALYGTALLWSLEEPLVITIIADDKKAGKFLPQLNKMYIPQKVVKILSLKRERDRIRNLGYPVDEAVYVCSGKKCSPAFTRPEELITGIKRFVKNLDRTDK